MTEDEVTLILGKWAQLRSLADLLAHDDGVEPITMLDYCTDLIGLVWEVRRAIDDGWHQANRRAFPDPLKKPRSSDPVLRAIEDIKALGLTQEEVIAIAREARK